MTQNTPPPKVSTQDECQKEIWNNTLKATANAVIEEWSRKENKTVPIFIAYSLALACLRLEASQQESRAGGGVSLRDCAMASYRACSDHYNGKNDPLHNPEAVHYDIAKAVLKAAKVPYEN